MDSPVPPREDIAKNNAPPEPNQPLQRLWARLVSFGMADRVLRAASAVFTALMLAGVVLILSRFYASASGSTPAQQLPQESAPSPTEPAFAARSFQKEPPQETKSKGIAPLVSLHTILPSRGRTELVSYVIQAGDTLFSIAEKFGLRPESILWGNRYTLGEDPHMIYPGQELLILPLDGTLHRWSAGEGLNGVAAYYGVSPDTIVNYPGNHLNPADLGDYSLPNIAPGTLLIIPGGKGEFPDWRTPRITRKDPATAVNVGPGACTGSYDGVMGTLNFIWPVSSRYLSGYDYSPEANHYGIDIHGEIGEPVFASDNGVVVYAGWNDWGYGEMIVIDHGQGWQTLYAHLSTVDVTCGQEVYQGDTIGTVGTTGNSSGPHLHFELRSDDYGRVNPWDFLR